MVIVENCTRCKRLCTSRRAIVNGAGPIDAEIWIIGQGPSRQEEIENEPHTGWAKDRTTYLCKLAGIDPTDVRYENIIRCRPPRGKAGDLPPTPAEIANCREYLLDDIAQHTPRFIISLGSSVTTWFFPGMKISEVHGRQYNWTHPTTNLSLTVIPMYHPTAAHPSRKPGLAQVMIEDWERLENIIMQGPTFDDRTYRAITEEELAEYLTDVKKLSFDFETTDPRWKGTFQPIRAQMIGVSISKNGKEGVYYFGNVIPDCLKEVLENPNIDKRAHNAIFEYIVANKHGVTVQNLHCTKLMSYILRLSTTYLKGLTWTQLGLEQTHFDEVDWDDPEAVVNYSGADAALTDTLADKFEVALKSEGLWDLYELERHCLPVIGDMTLRGINIDLAPLLELKAELTKEKKLLTHQLLNYFHAYELPKRDYPNLNSSSQLTELLYGPPHFRCVSLKTLSGRLQHTSDCIRKYCTNIECADGIRTGAETQLRWLVPGLGWRVKVRTDSGLPATDMDTLRLYQGEQCVADLVKLKSINRLLDNELTRWPELIQEDGKIHPSFHQSGHWEERGPGKESPNTGRFSSSGPNFQNITHHGDTDRPYVVEWATRLRRAIIPEKGMILWKGDIGQEEPRIGAMRADDAELLEDLTNGDVYMPIAALAFKRVAEELGKEERQIGKRNWMAWLNGAGSSGIQQAAFWLNTPDATQIIKYLQNRHPLIEKRRTDLIQHLHEHGYTKTFFGRKIYRPEVWSGPGPARNHAERSVMPDDIQGSAADVMKIWMSRVTEKLPKDAHLLLTVHDELVCECLPTQIEEVKRAMTVALSGILPIALPFELSSGPSWADLSEPEIVWTLPKT